ncbi:MAG: LysM peptidoglycan-binding domain-containing protein [Flavobacteriales bacterium]|nr:LysM peptidoglycan-binding domain-containing protein [Flavobacteriales bacterium]
MKFKFLVILFLAVAINCIAQSKDSSITILDDDPVLAAIDSMMASGYFESLGFNDNVDELNTNGYAKDSVPVFDSLTYAKRFEILNANSPFSIVYNSYVVGYVNLYAKRRRRITAKMLGLAPMYFPIFEENLDKYGLPLELKYLPIIESALNPKAKSRVGATGLWQFMYPTGKMFGLTVTSYYDERSDVYKSTDAACRYLKYLHKMYDDWDLALAAYNCGPGNVNKAIRRSGGKTSYWEIRNYLPRETRGYVPAFLAVNYIMAYASEHNIYPKTPDISCFKVDTIGLSDHLSFAQISEYLDIPIEYIEFLNPTYKQNFIPNTGEANTLCLPVGKIGDFLTNEKAIYALKTEQDKKDSIAFAQNKPISSTKKGGAIVYRVRSGDNLGAIAQRYHCRVSQIKGWNNLYSDRLSIGQKLYIYAKPSYAVQNKKKAQVDAQKAKPKSDGKYLYHTVKSGDNLWDIANKYEGVSIEQIQKLNKAIDTKKLKLGTKLRIKAVG